MPVYLLIVALLIPPPDRDLEPFKGSSPRPFTATVESVSDGDTLTVRPDGQATVKIRLNRIDAPESTQDFGPEARKFTDDLCTKKRVTIYPRGLDKYDRTIAEVELEDGRNLNRLLVAEGCAWWFRKYAPGDAELERLETDARKARIGLWVNPDAISPWDYRASGDPKYQGIVFANKRRRIYHKPGCPNGQKIVEKNRVEFADEAGAKRAGYRPGGDCHKWAEFSLTP